MRQEPRGGLPVRRPLRGAFVSGLSEEDRRLLLRVAREALAAHFAGQTYRPGAAAGAVGEARGAFVSLHRRDDDDLRGCVGQIESAEPLVETVARMAVAAATHDGRFEAVTREELPELVVEISALGPMRAVRPEEVEVGRDGLIVSCADRRGVLLPQVPGGARLGSRDVPRQDLWEGGTRRRCVAPTRREAPRVHRRGLRGRRRGLTARLTRGAARSSDPRGPPAGRVDSSPRGRPRAARRPCR